MERTPTLVDPEIEPFKCSLDFPTRELGEINGGAVALGRHVSLWRKQAAVLAGFVKVRAGIGMENRGHDLVEDYLPFNLDGLPIILPRLAGQSNHVVDMHSHSMFTGQTNRFP